MRRGIIVGGLLGLLGAGALARSVELEELMQLLAARKHGEVSFVEQHFFKLLKRPVESYGELTYESPDRLEKRTVAPRPETLTVAGDSVTVQRGGRSRTVDLASHPEILPFIESIRATLAGDQAALERLFRVEFSGSLARWMLMLVPNDAALAKTIAEIRIAGSYESLSTVEVRETDGDRSLTTLREHQPR
jgi:hypothetical protein